jgi:tetratricopeptide (TPR) repeat protein
LAAYYNNRGVAYGKSGLSDLALSDLNQAIQLNPNDASAYSNRGLVLKRKGLYDQAIREFDHAIALDPRDPKAYSNRGSVLNIQTLYDLAIADCSKAISIDVNFRPAYINRGEAYASKHMVDEAISDYTKAIGLPEAPSIMASAYAHRASLYSVKKMHDASIADYVMVTSLKPDNADAFNGLAWEYHEKGADAEGLPYVQKAVALAPSDPYALETRAEIYEKLGRTKEAIADYQATLKLDATITDATEGLRRLTTGAAQ